MEGDFDDVGFKQMNVFTFIFSTKGVKGLNHFSLYVKNLKTLEIALKALLNFCSKSSLSKMPQHMF